MVFSQLAYTKNVNMQLKPGTSLPNPAYSQEEEVAALSTYMAVSKAWKYFYSFMWRDPPGPIPGGIR